MSIFSWFRIQFYVVRGHDFSIRNIKSEIINHNETQARLVAGLSFQRQSFFTKKLEAFNLIGMCFVVGFLLIDNGFHKVLLNTLDQYIDSKISFHYFINYGSEYSGCSFYSVMSYPGVRE